MRVASQRGQPPAGSLFLHRSDVATALRRIFADVRLQLNLARPRNGLGIAIQLWAFSLSEVGKRKQVCG